MVTRRQTFARDGLLLVLCVLAWGCGDAPSGAPSTYVFRGETMGTTYTVKVVAASIEEAGRQALASAIREELDAVDHAMSTYRDDSELSRLNRHPAGEPFRLSAATFAVLEQALAVGRATEGAFDVTLGPLVDAWGFGPDGTPRTVPTADVLEALRVHTGLDKLRLDAPVSSVVKAHRALEINLSGIAKGYGVDRVATRLVSEGHPDHLVEVGGEMRAGGSNAGASWRIGIERPGSLPEGRRTQRIVPLDDAAGLATSGDYRNFVVRDGVRLSHIIDPRSTRPIDHALASVSVLADDCATADAWSTGLMVLGEEEGMRVALAHGLAALFLVRDGDGYDERMTPAFRSRIGLAAGEEAP